MYNICILGASAMWAPRLITDLICVFDEPLEIRLVDIAPQALDACAAWGRAANRHHRRRDKYLKYTDRKKALRGADAVIITIATGGLDAMAHDLKIPERYGIFATVGDTSGPGGWSRAIRNIPVFREFAEDFQRYCPNAFIANYTNPMAVLTATLQQCCGNPSVGLCHAYFETKDIIQKIFGLENWNPISLAIAGVNHFTWVVDFKIGREDGYRLLRAKLKRKKLADILPRKSADEIGFSSGHLLCAELYETFGYLPYPGDRHTCEFLSFAVANNPARYNLQAAAEKYDVIKYCDIRRTEIFHRRQGLRQRDRNIADWISGAKAMPKKTRETGAEMIRAFLENQPFTDAVNKINTGQIPGLPAGACVETLGVVDGMGVRALVVENIPAHLLEVMRPPALCQQWVVAGVLQSERNLLLQALYRDPQCAGLKPAQVRDMADELFKANQPFVKI